jgi:hypothetical protein
MNKWLPRVRWACGFGSSGPNSYVEVALLKAFHPFRITSQAAMIITFIIAVVRLAGQT